MGIVELTKEQFDEYAKKHQNCNFYQTSQYGTLMSRHGFTDLYIGLIDNNQIKAASLILVKTIFGRLKYGYAPRGYLVDFNDYILLRNFTAHLQKFLYKQGFIYLKIDPYVINTVRNKEGQVIEEKNENALIKFLKKIGYEHLGFNLYFETLKPRWNMVTKVNCSSKKLFTLFDKEVRNKIRKAERKGIMVYEGTKEELKDFYKLVQKKHTRKLDYYLDYYEIFSKEEMISVFFVKLIPEQYLKNSRNLYEKELNNNNLLSDKMQQQTKKNNHLLNKKMESDKILNVYKQDLIFATKLLEHYPGGIILGTSLIIKYEKEIFFMIDGYKPKFQYFPASYLLKWKIMQKYAKEGYLYIHHNAITGDFNETNKFLGLYQFKKGFYSNITEYIGEFNLVINRKFYSFFKDGSFVSKLVNKSLKDVKLKK
ncbi:MAG: lipid II:glycine glycyltransferase FemX [Bacilli bacterium]